MSENVMSPWEAGKISVQADGASIGCGSPALTLCGQRHEGFLLQTQHTENPEIQAAHKPPLSSGEMLPLSAGLMALTYIPHISQPPEWSGDLESEFDVSIPSLHWLYKLSFLRPFTSMTLCHVPATFYPFITGLHLASGSFCLPWIYHPDLPSYHLPDAKNCCRSSLWSQLNQVL